MENEKLTGIIWLWGRSNGGPCEDRNKPSCSVQDRESLNHLIGYQFLKMTPLLSTQSVSQSTRQ